jgi:hypothetical protein
MYSADYSLKKTINDRGTFTEPLHSNDKGIFTEPLPSNDRGDTQTAT